MRKILAPILFASSLLLSPLPNSVAYPQNPPKIQESPQVQKLRELELKQDEVPASFSNGKERLPYDVRDDILTHEIFYFGKNGKMGEMIFQEIIDMTKRNSKNFEFSWNFTKGELDASKGVYCYAEKDKRLIVFGGYHYKFRRLSPNDIRPLYFLAEPIGTQEEQKDILEAAKRYYQRINAENIKINPKLENLVK